MITAEYRAPMEPRWPCREMTTRHCPAIYEHVENGVRVGGCGDDRPCARYESEDETPWLPEIWFSERRL